MISSIVSHIPRSSGLSPLSPWLLYNQAHVASHDLFLFWLIWNKCMCLIYLFTYLHILVKLRLYKVKVVYSTQILQSGYATQPYIPNWLEQNKNRSNIPSHGPALHSEKARWEIFHFVLLILTNYFYECQCLMANSEQNKVYNSFMLAFLIWFWFWWWIC